MPRMLLVTVCVVILCAVLSAAPVLAFPINLPADVTLLSYTGSLHYPAGLGGQGSWTQAPMSIEWAIQQGSDGWWSYDYVFSHRTPATSHFILEVSEDFTRDQIRAFNWNFEDDDPRWYGPHVSNPGIPGSIFGIKFDDVDGTETLIQFESSRSPVWGDFYAKGGPTSGAWNLGFLDPDPIDPPTSGSIANKILRPNGNDFGTPIPEPAGVLLMGAALIGMAAFAAVRRRRS